MGKSLMKTRNLLGISVLVLVSTSGCTALRTGAAIMDAGASVATVISERAARARLSYGYAPEQFSALRIGMPDETLRALIGDPTTSHLTPEGWTCHTYQPVLTNGGDPKKAGDYIDQYRVLSVDRGEGLRVSGWALDSSGSDRPNCEGL